MRGALGGAVCLLLLALGPVAARAALTIESFGSGAFTDAGEPEIQAGASMHVLHSSISFGQTEGMGSVEHAVLGLPRGLFFNPTAGPTCALADFDAFECPAATQVGLITARAEIGSEPSALLGTAPVYMLVAEAGEVARLGVVLPTLEIPVEIPVRLRTDTDFGADLAFEQLPEATPLKTIDFTLWGIPAHFSGGPCPAAETREHSQPPKRPAPLATPPTVAVPPVVKITRKPPRRAPDRTPTFRFVSNAPDATFSCKADARRFRSCTSPKTLGKLALGPHTFTVRASDRAGVKSKPAAWKFTVAARPPRKHRR